MMNITLKPWTTKDANSYIEMMEHVDFTYEDEELRCTDISEAQRQLKRMQVGEDYNGDFYRAVFLDGRLVGHVLVVLLRILRLLHTPTVLPTIPPIASLHPATLRSIHSRFSCASSPLG